MPPLVTQHSQIVLRKFNMSAMVAVTFVCVRVLVRVKAFLVSLSCFSETMYSIVSAFRFLQVLIIVRQYV